ncbi:DUF6503 family protein [Eudoraea sp.]|uniref:DUF6503 family protein n=1 Tax=Eudoraea sp. TaxID=1979955 RepID=UPI003C76F950
MFRYTILAAFCFIMACKEKPPQQLTAQQIIDKSIEASGGLLLQQSEVSFLFRDMSFERTNTKQGKVLKRTVNKDGTLIHDVYSPSGFERYVNGDLTQIADSMARKYQNSINSVHYFAYLPEGLNDAAVHKKLIGETTIKDKLYYQIEVTFDEEDGGEDFDDIYIYWIDKETFKPDYLAYQFSVNKGGIRFREAFNERIINGIRFVDYKNYGLDGNLSVYEAEEKYINQELPLKSTITLKEINVNRGSYN